MSDQYVSSIVNKYGDNAKVPLDSRTMTDILARQGVSFALDVLAEFVGRTANRHKLRSVDRALLLGRIPNELQEALKERL